MMLGIFFARQADSLPYRVGGWTDHTAGPLTPALSPSEGERETHRQVTVRSTLRRTLQKRLDGLRRHRRATLLTEGYLRRSRFRLAAGWRCRSCWPGITRISIAPATSGWAVITLPNGRTRKRCFARRRISCLPSVSGPSNSAQLFTTALCRIGYWIVSPQMRQFYGTSE